MKRNHVSCDPERPCVCDCPVCVTAQTKVAALPSSAETPTPALTRYVLAVNTYLAREDDPDHPVRPIAQGAEPVYLASEVALALRGVAEELREIGRMGYQARVNEEYLRAIADTIEALAASSESSAEQTKR